MDRKGIHFVCHITSALLLGSCLFLLLGCDSTSVRPPLSSSLSPISSSPSLAPVQGSFVGEVTSVDDTQTPAMRYETNLFIGLVSNGKQILACLTDGTPHDVTLFIWYIGDIHNGVADLQNTASDPGLADAVPETMHVTLSSDTITGMLRISPGTDAHNVFPYQYRLEFHASLVSAVGKAGVYRAQPTLDHQSYTAAWVVLPDGQQRGASANLVPVGSTSYSRVTPVLSLPPDATSVLVFSHQEQPVSLERLQPTSSFLPT